METKFVITGASGFLGKYLVAEFKKRGLSYFGYTRGRHSGLIKVAVYEEVNPINGDSVLIHLAQPKDANSHSDGQEIQLCEKLFSKKWSHIVYISSALLYGSDKSYPRYPEEPVVPDNEYKKVKLACEILALKRDGTCLRLTNTYGADVQSNTVFGDILGQIPGSGPLVVRDASPIRDFLWVEDAAVCIANAAVFNKPGLFNVGTGSGTSIKDVAKLFLKLSNEEGREVKSTINGRKTSCLILDISKTRSFYDWSPEVDIAHGVSKIVKRRKLNG